MFDQVNLFNFVGIIIVPCLFDDWEYFGTVHDIACDKNDWASIFLPKSLLNIALMFIVGIIESIVHVFKDLTIGQHHTEFTVIT